MHIKKIERGKHYEETQNSIRKCYFNSAFVLFSSKLYVNVEPVLISLITLLKQKYNSYISVQTWMSKSTCYCPTIHFHNIFFFTFCSLWIKIFSNMMCHAWQILLDQCPLGAHFISNVDCQHFRPWCLK